jgi:uncharacterized protein YprB with RNaseH-like and TPR domain
MIESTFVLLKGVGESSERRLWRAGISSWRAFLDQPTVPGISSARKSLYDDDLLSALRHLREGEARYFSRCLKPRDHWRLFQAFRDRAVFLDIETTGMDRDRDEITVAGLYSTDRMVSLVRGTDLTADRIEAELADCRLLVTFCGSLFDLPFLRAKFPRLRLDLPHFDLCFAGRRLGWRGGLKHIEGRLGIGRSEELRGIGGLAAVTLWHAWEQGNAEAGRLLLRYNEADARNLVLLAERCYGGLMSAYSPPALDGGTSHG